MKLALLLFLLGCLMLISDSMWGLLPISLAIYLSLKLQSDELKRPADVRGPRGADSGLSGSGVRESGQEQTFGIQKVVNDYL